MVSNKDGHMSLEMFVAELLAIPEAERGPLASPKKTGVTSYPIPFFGRVDVARVLTVGVNPSAGEFQNRGWPSHVDGHYLTQRLLQYFERGSAHPHPWFRVWQSALRTLDISYLTGDAAHIDISPWATAAMSQNDPEDFAAMMQRDIPKMFNLIDKLINVRLLLMAGTVTKKYYMNDFVARTCKNSGWELAGPSPNSGAGRVAFQVLKKGQRALPCFFCSVSPSSYNNAELLVQRVDESSDKLRLWLEG